jgi:hypothetical protein
LIWRKQANCAGSRFSAGSLSYMIKSTKRATNVFFAASFTAAAIPTAAGSVTLSRYWRA